ACGMPEQIIDLLESVEIQTQDCESSTRHERLFYFMIKSAVEAAAIGKSGERVIESQKAYMFFRLLARAKITNRDRAVRFAGKIDSTLNEFDQRPRSILMKQVAFYRLVRVFPQLLANPFIGKALSDLHADHIAHGATKKRRK